MYPAQVKTLVNQLMEAGLTWKGYMEDMGNDPARESSTCGHPPLNALDLTERAEAPSTAVPQGDMYATRHDPFMYLLAKMLATADEVAAHRVRRQPRSRAT